mmetsp:Transcript_20438/g.19425  ORF Transcript_20438/g.19425 Transcript_20438/m.19425 type:complete len:109 (-) Transcript_20438:241-567(-)
MTDFKQTCTLKPFYLKAIHTLREIVKNEFQLPHLFIQYLQQYSEITYENTTKLLLRCEVFMRARRSLILAFQAIHKRLELMKIIKTRISELEYEIEESEEEEELKELG